MRYLGCIGRGLLFLVVLFLGVLLVGALFPFLLILAIGGFLFGACAG